MPEVCIARMYTLPRIAAIALGPVALGTTVVRPAVRSMRGRRHDGWWCLASTSASTPTAAPAPATPTATTTTTTHRHGRSGTGHRVGQTSSTRGGRGPGDERGPAAGWTKSRSWGGERHCVPARPRLVRPRQRLTVAEITAVTTVTSFAEVACVAEVTTTAVTLPVAREVPVTELTLAVAVSSSVTAVTVPITVATVAVPEFPVAVVAVTVTVIAPRELVLAAGNCTRLGKRGGGRGGGRERAGSRRAWERGRATTASSGRPRTTRARTPCSCWRDHHGAAAGGSAR